MSEFCGGPWAWAVGRLIVKANGSWHCLWQTCFQSSSSGSIMYLPQASLGLGSRLGQRQAMLNAGVAHIAAPERESRHRLQSATAS